MITSFRRFHFRYVSRHRSVLAAMLAANERAIASMERGSKEFPSINAEFLKSDVWRNELDIIAQECALAHSA